MSKNTTDEQMKHYNKIIDEFDSAHMPAKQREIIMTEIEQLISNREKLLLDRVEKLIIEQIEASEENLKFHQEQTKNRNIQIEYENCILGEKWCLEAVATLRKELDGEEPTHE